MSAQIRTKNKTATEISLAYTYDQMISKRDGTLLRIGILPEDEIRKRTLAIASGKYKPSPSDPKIWFTSMKSVAEVLNDRNIALLRLIAEQNPQSVSELAEASGRKVSNLSRTLKTLAQYGIVDLQKVDNKRVRPVAKYTRFLIAA